MTSNLRAGMSAYVEIDTKPGPQQPAPPKLAKDRP
jgi:hypothetical protein